MDATPAGTTTTTWVARRSASLLIACTAEDGWVVVGLIVHACEGE